jgi:hypothetical protein
MTFNVLRAGINPTSLLIVPSSNSSRPENNSNVSRCWGSPTRKSMISCVSSLKLREIMLRISSIWWKRLPSLKMFFLSTREWPLLPKLSPEEIWHLPTVWEVVLSRKQSNTTIHSVVWTFLDPVLSPCLNF